jgi:hypothetical protein
MEGWRDGGMEGERERGREGVGGTAINISNKRILRDV